MAYRGEYAEVSKDGATDSERTEGTDQQADAERHVAGGVDEVELIVSVDEPLER